MIMIMNIDRTGSKTKDSQSYLREITKEDSEIWKSLKCVTGKTKNSLKSLYNHMSVNKTVYSSRTWELRSHYTDLQYKSYNKEVHLIYKYDLSLSAKTLLSYQTQ